VHYAFNDNELIGNQGAWHALCTKEGKFWDDPGLLTNNPITHHTAMKLIRYQHPLTDSFSDLDRWFRTPLEGFGRLLEFADRLGGLTSMGMSGLGGELYEDEGHYFARFELPGVKKEDLSIELHDHQLTISCERRKTGEKPEASAEATVYKRVLTVPDGIEAAQVSAKLEDGILTVTMPKSAERKPRQISVN
jgi:HSP20 family protein